MNYRILATLTLLVITASAYSGECVQLQPKTPAYDIATKAMAGHFTVELSEIQDCGKAAGPRHFTATADTYQSHKAWRKSGQLDCWQLSQHKAGEPYSCTRKIISQNGQLGIEIESEYEISLDIIDEATVNLTRLLTKADQIESMDYIPVHCGGAWAIDRHGYLLKLKSKTRGMQRQFVAKKDCSGPCLWEIKEVEPKRWRN
ncbi:MAG: hypothetical protein ACI9J0_004610 [Cryomorphaceae bacterium]|jgi:hypothetical protein